MRNINKKIKLSLLSLLLMGVFMFSIFLLYFQVGCASPKSFFKKIISYAYAAPYATTDSGTCQIEYETYEMAGSYITVPTKGNTEQSQKFEGYDVYEYFYPANPEKNNDKRKKLYSFNANGSLEVSGNLVVNGTRTYLYNEYPNGQMKIGAYSTATDGTKSNHFNLITLDPKSSDVVFGSESYINAQWNASSTDGLGPSLFVNNNSGKLDMGDDYYASGANNDIVIETSFKNKEDDYVWEEYFGTGEGDYKLKDPRAMFYEEPYMYIADSGNRRIVRYNDQTEEFITLGRSDWNWKLGGIVVDGGVIFTTDSVNNTVIRTTIGGGGWKESYQNIDDYQSRLYLEGSEKYKLEGYYKNYSQYAIIKDCGYNAHKIIATGTPGYIRTKRLKNDTTSSTEIIIKPRMLSTDDCAFGDDCFYFSGQEHMDLKDSAAWNFGKDHFTIDLWVKFESLDKDMAIITHPNSFLFEWDFYNYDRATSTLNFSFLSEKTDEEGNYGTYNYQHDWSPEKDEWYHLSIIRDDNDDLIMRVDGKTLGDPIPIRGKLKDGDGLLQIGAYEDKKNFHGQMDEIRIARGRSQWEVDYSELYRFNDPKGIIAVDNWLYIVDSRAGRIVRINKNFDEWSTFGEKGSGEYQFKNPTDIYYHEDYFYITDTGNNRVIKTDMEKMKKYLKGEEEGTWEVLETDCGSDLTAVVVDDDDNVYISDAYNAKVLKNGNKKGGKNPWNLLFTFSHPVDLQMGRDGNILVLDGTSERDFTTGMIKRAMDIFGTSQKEDINVRFNTGGLITDRFNSADVVARFNKKDWYKWVVGPDVAHCPNAGNTAVDFTSYANSSGCGTLDGRGNVVDCRNASGIPASECVGQWDWESVWPSCVTYAPAVSGCYSYCRQVEHDCHEGTAVGYDFYEAGPPHWYLTSHYAHEGTNSGFAGAPNLEEGGGGGEEDCGTLTYGTDPGYHHYNPAAWDGLGWAIVFCEGSPQYTSCSVNDIPLSRTGEDKCRQLFAVNGQTLIDGTVRCDGPSGSFSTTVSGASSEIQYGTCQSQD